MAVNSGEILFVKSVKDGIPNRDPLADSDARRIFDDGRISLSDVSLKRDVRDYVLAKAPDGGLNKRNYVFVREERRADGSLLGRKDLVIKIINDANPQTKIAELDNPEEWKKAVLPLAFDARVFGMVFSVAAKKKGGKKSPPESKKDDEVEEAEDKGKKSFHLTGPVQFGWAHSLHPVETRYVQGTVVMPSEEEGKGQGTIWTTYTLPFAVFAMPGVVNASIARETGMDEADMELLLEGLWRGTQHRQARGRGNQQPLFLLHVEYKDPFFRLGYLEEGVSLEPPDGAPKGLNEVRLDLRRLGETLARNEGKIARCRHWTNAALGADQVLGEIPGEAGKPFGD